MNKTDVVTGLMSHAHVLPVCSDIWSLSHLWKAYFESFQILLKTSSLDKASHNHWVCNDRSLTGFPQHFRGIFCTVIYILGMKLVLSVRLQAP